MARKNSKQEDKDTDMPAMNPEDHNQGEKGGRADDQGQNEDTGRERSDEDTAYRDEDIM